MYTLNIICGQSPSTQSINVKRYDFVFAEEPPPELIETNRISQPFYYMDMKTAIPVLGTCIVVLVVVCTAFVCLKRSK